jgi:tetratricopeptide (TPR) repeat protein
MQFQNVAKKIRVVVVLGVLLFFTSGNKSREANLQIDSPISLTSSDGAGLVLKSYESNTVLDGFFAFTEIKLSFYNPEDRQREGRFRITLPDNAHLARFAMKIDNVWQEGEVVEREKATRVYEDFLHRKQDPALLETDAGNEFSARIFPIPARAEKKIILSYSTTLSGFPPVFTLPVVGLPEMEEFILRVMFEADEFQTNSDKASLSDDAKLVSRKIFSVNKKNFKPKNDFVFEHKAKQNLISMQGKNFAMKLIPITEGKEKLIPLENLVILVDTSASSTLHYSETILKLESLVDSLNLKDSYFFGFDTGLTSYGKGSSGIQKLKEVMPLGSSNLSKSIAELSKIIGDQEFRLLVVSDGVLTSGEISKKEISEILRKQTWITRLDFLIPSAYKDTQVIESLLISGKQNGIAISMESQIKEIERRLKHSVSKAPKININNADWIYTDTLTSLQPGDPITIYGAMKSEGASPVDQMTLDGKQLKNFTVVTTEQLLLEREVTAARINRLLELADKETNSDIARGLKLQATELSTSFRIQCTLTSFLVLETADDYMRFQITRNALTDIMTIGLGGIEVINRKTMVSYDFLSPENMQRRKAEEVERNRVLREKQKLAEQEKAKDDSKKIESAPSVTPNTQGVSTEDISMEESKISDNKPSTEANIEGTIAEPIPVIQDPKKENLPSRNTFRLESRITDVRPQQPAEKREKIDPYQGKLKEFYIYLNAGENLKALAFAKKWRAQSPEDILALLALGDSYFALGDRKNAVRAYSSFVDYFPRRADIRRWSGEKLLSIGMYEDAIDTFQKALSERPDHPSSYHLLAISYIKTNQWKRAYDTLMLGLNQTFPSRFQSVHDVLYDDLDLLYTLVKHNDKEKLLPLKEQNAKLKLNDLDPEIRFVLVWETDANDVDFHIYDKDDHHAFYSEKQLKSGGELYADITGGYGPECFRIIKPKAFPYRLEAHYYSRGPMGYGMGALQVIRFDGEKKLEVETRSFVIMNDGAYVDLGKVK